MDDELAWVWAWNDLDVKLKVSSKVEKVFSNYRQKIGEYERGGQLFIDINRADGLWLVDATLPHPDDRAGRSWLILDSVRCRQEILSANQKGLRLVGYWHTHPEIVPNLSSQDIKSFNEFSLKNSEHLACPLAIIVGNGHNENSIRAWSLQNKKFILGSLIADNKCFTKF